GCANCPVSALDLVLALQDVHGLVFAMMDVKWQTTVRLRGFNCQRVCSPGILCGRLAYRLYAHDSKLRAFAIPNNFETTFVRAHQGSFQSNGGFQLSYASRADTHQSRQKSLNRAA